MDVNTLLEDVLMIFALHKQLVSYSHRAASIMTV